MKMKGYSIIAICVISSPGLASPPPPPPTFLQNATSVLAPAGSVDLAKARTLFADNVKVVENGTIISRSIKDFDSWEAKTVHHTGQILGFSQGYEGNDTSLLILETFDQPDVVRPKNTFADPRMEVRSVMYKFGNDQVIHEVYVSKTMGFWTRIAR